MRYKDVLRLKSMLRQLRYKLGLMIKELEDIQEDMDQKQK